MIDAATSQDPTASKIWTPPGGAIIAAQDRRTARHGLLFPSPLNPRKHFDETELAALAQTIAEQGVIQNLTVRAAHLPGFESGDKNGFEIAAGERRWRAVGLLIAQGLAPSDYPLPIVVRDMNDAELVTLAMIENLDRDDLTDLELARGFAVMGESMSTESIAIKVGKSPRFIQQRLSLIERAAPELVQALSDGKITFSQARGAVVASPREQVKIVKEIAANPTMTEQAVKTRAIGGIPSVSAAFFDRALYKGEIVRDEDTGAEYFADIKEFARLQRVAAEQRKEELIAEGATWVSVFDYAKKQFFNETLYAKYPGHDKAGVAIEIRINHHVVIHRDLVLHADIAKAAARPSGVQPNGTQSNQAANTATPKAEKSKSSEKTDPLDSFTPAHRIHAHMRKTAALQMALMDNPVMAKKLLCFALVQADAGFTEQEEITRIGILHDNRTIGFKDVEFEGVAKVQDARDKLIPRRHLSNAAGLWKFIASLDEKKVDLALAALVAEQCGTFCMDGTPLDDAPIVVAVAQSLKINQAPHALPLVPGDLEGLRKSALLAVARELKAAEAADSMTADQLRDICAHHLKKGHRGLELPTLRFLNGEAMDKACADFVAECKPALSKTVATKPIVHSRTDFQAAPKLKLAGKSKAESASSKSPAKPKLPAKKKKKK